MSRLMLLLTLAFALLTSYALADDWDGQSNVIRADVAKAAEGTAASVHDTRPVQTAAPADKATMGSFLGTGDQFAQSGVPDDTTDPGTPDADHGTSWADVPPAQAQGDDALVIGEEGDMGYLSENVFGPLWGVPDDAQGLDEFRAAREEYQSGHRHIQRDGSKEEAAADDDSADDGGHSGRGMETHTINRGDPNDW